MSKKKDNQYGRGDESKRPSVVKTTPGAPEPLKRPRTPLDSRMECAFIAEDPQYEDFRYCGHPTVRGTSYCAFHLGVITSPQARK